MLSRPNCAIASRQSVLQEVSIAKICDARCCRSSARVQPDRQIGNQIDHRIRNLRRAFKIRLPEFFGAHQNAGSPCALRATDIGLDAIADHERMADVDRKRLQRPCVER